MKKLLCVMTIASMAVFTGCSSTGPKLNRNAVLAYPTTEGVLEIISAESQKAMNAAKQLAKYQDSYNATLSYRQRQFDNDQVMIDYIGKPNEVLNSIAIRYGYRYIELGNAQELPTVNFTKYWTTPSGAIIDLNAKLGDSANIAVDKEQKVITLIYPNANQTSVTNTMIDIQTKQTSN